MNETMNISQNLNEKLNQAVEILVRCFKRGNKLLLCGNGGSAADCGHIVGELAKGFMLPRPMDADFIQKIGQPWGEKLQQGLPAIDLTANGPLISAISNDIDGASVYAQQVVAYGNKGDVLIGISTSGNAQNVIRALETAGAKGMTTLGLTGKTGGRMAGLCDLLIASPQVETYLVQQDHLALYHQLCMKVEERLFKNEQAM